MLPKKIRLSRCILMVLLASCGAGNGDSAGAQERTSVHSRRGVGVAGYCEKFAREYSRRNGLRFRDGSARTVKSSDVMTWISNVFQPPDSRFTSGYDCRFQAEDAGGRLRDVSVGVFLTKTLRFAEHTKWEDLQIVPVEYVVDETNGRAGYGVFKYLEKAPE